LVKEFVEPANKYPPSGDSTASTAKSSPSPPNTLDHVLVGLSFPQETSRNIAAIKICGSITCLKSIISHPFPNSVPAIYTLRLRLVSRRNCSLLIIHWTKERTKSGLQEVAETGTYSVRMAKFSRPQEINPGLLTSGRRFETCQI
jgi:hypothetical protein